MSRILPTGFNAAVTASVVRPAFFVELDWSDGILYVWNGYGSIVFGGNTYLGTGHLGKISEVKESKDLTANGVTLALSGIPSALITEALANDNQGRPAKIYIGALAGDGTLAAAPYLIFDGVIDLTVIADTGDTSTISVQLEKELVDNRSGARRYTHEDQQIDFPGDLGFQYVAALSTQIITWGVATATPGPAPGEGGDSTNPLE
jgi:hypothetical protein